MSNHFYISVNGESQGAFEAESPGAGDGRSLCKHFRFAGSANNDPLRGKSNAARSQEPLAVVKPWGIATPQFTSAFWNKEILSVTLTFVYADGQGNPEAPFMTIDLTKATIATYELLAGRSQVSVTDIPWTSSE